MSVLSPTKSNLHSVRQGESIVNTKSKAIINTFFEKRLPQEQTIQAVVTPEQTGKQTVKEQTVTKMASTPQLAEMPTIVLEPLVLQAIGGKMGGFDYYVTTMTVSDVNNRLSFAPGSAKDDKTPSEEKYQRTLNTNRINGAMVDYLAEDEHFYAPIVASVDNGGVKITNTNGMLYTLELSGDAVCPISDGQHRVASLKKAVSEGNTALESEQVGVVFIADLTIDQKQQLFSDLNRNAKLPPKAVGILFDHRQTLAIITRKVAMTGSLAKRVAMESATLSGKTGNRFITLAVLYEMVKAFLLENAEAKTGKETMRKEFAGDSEEVVAKAAKYVSEAFEHVILPALPEWEVLKATDSHLVVNDIRKRYICYSSTGWQAIGRSIATAMQMSVKPETLSTRLKAIDWSLKNEQWKPCLSTNKKGELTILSRTEHIKAANGIVFSQLGESVTQ